MDPTDHQELEIYSASVALPSARRAAYLGKAYAWWSLGGTDNQPAERFRVALANELSPEQIFQAFKRTKELRAQIDARLKAQQDREQDKPLVYPGGDYFYYEKGGLRNAR